MCGQCLAILSLMAFANCSLEVTLAVVLAAELGVVDWLGALQALRVRAAAAARAASTWREERGRKVVKDPPEFVWTLLAI